MRSSRLLAWSCVLMVVGMVWAQAAQAQPRIRSTTQSTSTALDAEQQREVQTYVEHYVGAMLDAARARDAARLREAREALIRPAVGNPIAFSRAYARAASQPLARTQGEDVSLMLRLNGMIVIASLSDASLVPLIAKGLQDPSAAVRYWAGKAANETVQPTLASAATGDIPPKLADDAQRKLLSILAQRMLAEESMHVFQQMGLAVISMSIAESDAKLLEILNERVAWHMTNPEASLAAIAQITRLQANKVFLDAQRMQPQTLRNLAVTMYRYMRAYTALAGAERIEAEDENWLRLVTHLDALLTTITQELKGQGIPARLQAGAPSAVIEARIVINWADVLAGAPISIQRDDLLVPPVEPQPAAAQ